jgi:hypothetical protein
LKVRILKAIRAGRIPIEIEDHRRIPDVFGFHHIKVERIAKPPLQLKQFHGVVVGRIVNVANQRRGGPQAAVLESRRSPILFDTVKTSVSWIGYGRGRRHELSGGNLR